MTETIRVNGKDIDINDLDFDEVERAQAMREWRRKHSTIATGGGHSNPTNWVGTPRKGKYNRRMRLND